MWGRRWTYVGAVLAYFVPLLDISWAFHLCTLALPKGCAMGSTLAWSLTGGLF